MVSDAFALAGVGFVVVQTPSVPPLLLPEAYKPFLTAPSSDPACRFSLVPWEEPLPVLSPGTARWACETWRLGLSHSGDWSIEIHSLRGNDWIAVAQVAPDFSRARLRPIAGRQGGRTHLALNYPSDQAILVNRLLYFDAAVIHACGIVYGGRGYIFCGRSGVGKTTLARLWRKAGAILLNDDRIIVRRNQTFLVAATPWHGEDPEINTGVVPLGGIFHLAQAPRTRLAPVTGAMAAARLIANSVAPFYSPSGIERLLSLADTVADRVPSYDLEFTPDRHTIDVCMAAMATAA